jgi:hypothetical protein
MPPRRSCGPPSPGSAPPRDAAELLNFVRKRTPERKLRAVLASTRLTVAVQSHPENGHIIQVSGEGKAREAVERQVQARLGPLPRRLVWR